MVDYLSGLGLLPVLVVFYVGEGASLGSVEYGVGDCSVFSSPPDKASPEPAFLPLGVEIGLAVLYNFLDSVLHGITR